MKVAKPVLKIIFLCGEQVGDIDEKYPDFVLWTPELGRGN